MNFRIIIFLISCCIFVRSPYDGISLRVFDYRYCPRGFEGTSSCFCTATDEKDCGNSDVQQDDTNCYPVSSLIEDIDYEESKVMGDEGVFFSIQEAIRNDRWKTYINSIDFYVTLQESPVCNDSTKEETAVQFLIEDNCVVLPETLIKTDSSFRVYDVKNCGSGFFSEFGKYTSSFIYNTAAFSTMMFFITTMFFCVLCCYIPCGCIILLSYVHFLCSENCFGLNLCLSLFFSYFYSYVKVKIKEKKEENNDDEEEQEPEEELTEEEEEKKKKLKKMKKIGLYAAMTPFRCTWCLCRFSVGIVEILFLLVATQVRAIFILYLGVFSVITLPDNLLSGDNKVDGGLFATETTGKVGYGATNDAFIANSIFYMTILSIVDILVRIVFFVPLCLKSPLLFCIFEGVYRDFLPVRLLYGLIYIMVFIMATQTMLNYGYPGVSFLIAYFLMLFESITLLTNDNIGSFHIILKLFKKFRLCRFPVCNLRIATILLTGTNTILSETIFMIHLLQGEKENMKKIEENPNYSHLPWNRFTSMTKGDIAFLNDLFSENFEKDEKVVPEKGKEEEEEEKEEKEEEEEEESSVVRIKKLIKKLKEFFDIYGLGYFGALRNVEILLFHPPLSTKWCGTFCCVCCCCGCCYNSFIGLKRTIKLRKSLDLKIKYTSPEKDEFDGYDDGDDHDEGSEEEKDDDDDDKYEEKRDYELDDTNLQGNYGDYGQDDDDDDDDDDGYGVEEDNKPAEESVKTDRFGIPFGPPLGTLKSEKKNDDDQESEDSSDDGSSSSD